MTTSVPLTMKMKTTQKVVSSNKSGDKLLGSIYTPPIPQWQSYLFSSVAPTVVAPFTNPFAVAKTQLQVQRSEGPRQFKGMLEFFKYAAASDGVATLQRGLVPVMMREASKNVFRIGLYRPILDQIHNEKGSAPVWKRLIAGAISGGIGAIICNPFEIVRIKVQAQGIGEGSALKTTGMAGRILQQDGVGGFYKAGGASVALGCVCTAANLTSYTLLHEAAIEQIGFADGPVIDMICALASGFCAAVAMNPVDVVRTRLMAQPSPPIYQGAMDAATQIMVKEGPRAFFKGFLPSFLRIGPHFVLTFTLLEQMRRLAHKYNGEVARDQFLRNVFVEIDRDSSGEIDHEELVAAIEVADPFHRHSGAENMANEIFRQADSDGDGAISLNEFLSAAHTCELDELLRGHQLLGIFRSIDEDGDGTISEMELCEAIRRTRDDAPSASATKEERTRFFCQLRRDVKHIMDEIDADGDRSIDFSEFVAAFDKIEDMKEKLVLQDMMRGAGVALAE